MHYKHLQTPAILIDLEKAEANLERAQAYADSHNLPLRPHIKTHKLPYFAQKAIELGAIGITCQKLGEAEVMADAGIGDIFIPYNILGAEKLKRLRALNARVTLSVTADSLVTIKAYAAAFAPAHEQLTVLVECDTGGGRCGVQSPEEALELAKAIDDASDLTFGGLMTYPPRDGAAAVQKFFTEAKILIEEAGIAVPVLSNGGSPDLYAAHKVTIATEHRPGTYVYSDRMQVGFGLGTLDDCALTVLATVVSRPTGTRAILDTGSKALAADTCAAPGYGHIVEYPDAVITGLSEEHGTVDLSACPEKPAVGDLVRIIPNHVCVVSNLFDEVHLIDGDRVMDTLPVAARGKLA